MFLKDLSKINADMVDGKHASNTANNVPVLDSNAKLPIAQVPTGTTSSTVALGNHNHDSVYTKPTGTITANRVAVFNDTTGRVIKDSGYTIATSVPSGAKFTDTVYTHPNDANTRHVTDTEKSTWNAKETTSGSQAKADAALASAKSYTDSKVAELVDSSPEALNTLNELAEALGNDPNFATTVTTQIGNKADTTYVNTELAKKSDSSHTHNYAGSSSAGGSANSAVKLATARTITATGDATGSVSFDGSKNVSVGLTLSNSGATAGSYGPSANATASFGGTISVPQVTVDAKGRVTAASTKTITMPANPNSDTKVTNTLNTKAKAYITGTTSATTNTGTQVFDTGVYLDETEGKLVATTFQGNLVGNASTATTANSATKATQDSAGQQINTTYIKGLSASGKTITYTKGDGTTGTITTQDTDTHYTAKNIVGTSNTATANATSSTGSTYLNLLENGAVRSTHKITGSGATTVSSDASGNIVISSTDTNTNTTYSAGTGMALSGTTFNHKNSVTAGTAQGDASKTLSWGGTFTVPTVTYDAQGHITAKGTTTMTMPSNPNTDTHWTSGTVVGASATATANAASSNGSTYINHIENGAVRNAHKISGSGATTVTSDANGNIVISSTDSNTDTKVTNTLATTTKAYVTGTTSSSTNTGTQVFDTGVYLDTTAGTLTATTFKGALSGNASTATKLATARTITLNGTANGSVSFDGSGNVTISTHPRIFAGAGTSGTSGYVAFAKLVVTAAYANRPIEFKLISRGRATAGTISLMFASVNGTDPSLSSLRYWGSDYGVFAHKTGTSTWLLYCTKSEAYDEITLVGHDYASQGVTVTYPGTFITAKPTSNVTNASLGGNFGHANTANSATSATSATKATQDSAGQQINTTYIKGLSVSGKVITYTKGDGTTGTITTQDTNTTYSTGTASALGLTKLYTGTGTATDGTMTQAAINTALSGKANSSHGRHIPDACTTITDWNSATTNGWYMGNNATNSPTANAWYFGEVVTHNTNYVFQTVYQFTASTDAKAIPKYIRAKMNGTWGAWTNVTVAKAVPSNAVFTDTNTWRGVQDNLTSTATDQSLSANQGKVLKGLIDGKAASSHTHNYAGSSSAGGAATTALTCTGNSATATTLATARTINGTSFDGSANITTANWGTARTITLGAAGKSVNGSGNIAWSWSEMQVPRAYSSSYSFGGNQNAITTAQFITMLTNLGAFSQPYWVSRGSWAYASNQYINDTGCGNIHLAGCVVEVMGSTSAYTIRVTTPTTTSSGTTNAEFIYVNNGTDYSPGWRRQYNTKSKPTPAEIGAAATSHTHNYAGSSSAGGAANSATILATARTINGTSFNGSANITTANWGTARSIYIADNTSANTGPAVSVNGGANVSLKLPASIKAVTFTGALSGNATTATTLQTARTINGTSFNGSANITTANWGTARTLTIGNTGKSVNGSGNVSWTLSEIGAAAASHTHSYLPLSGGTISGNLTASNLNATNAGIGSLEISKTNGVVTFWDGYGVIRTYPQQASNALYLQCGASSEVKITAAGDAATYVPIRAYNLIAQNAVYAKGVNLASDRNLKENIKYLDVDSNLAKTSTEESDNNTTLKDMYDFIKDELVLASYNYTDDKDKKTKVNFIAQDLLYNNKNEDSKIGQLIVNAEEAVREDDTLKYDLGNYVSILAGALQYAINEIESLKTQLNNK